MHHEFKHSERSIRKIASTIGDYFCWHLQISYRDNEFN